MIGALVLAAGQSTRFNSARSASTLKNSSKLIARTSNGHTLIDQCLDQVESVFDRHLVVTNPLLTQLTTLLDQRHSRYCLIEKHLLSQNFSGMGDSIAFGMQHISRNLIEDWQAVVICLADMPFILRNTYESVYNALTQRDHDSIIVAPCVTSSTMGSSTLTRGHPVGFGKHYFTALSQLTGDQGAREVLLEHRHQLQLLPVEDQGIFEDIDTLDDLNNLGWKDRR